MDQLTLTELDKGRDIVINNLRQNIQIFAATLYSERTTGPFWNRKLETSSPFLQTNNPNICCLIETGNRSSTEVKPGICLVSTTQPLSHQGKESETRLVTSGNKRQPQYFVLKIYNLDSLDIRFFDKPRIPALWSTQCLYPQVADLKYLGSDNFTNEYLIGFILRDLYLRPQGLPPQLPSQQIQAQQPQLRGIQRFDGVNPGSNRLNGVIDFISATICNSGTSKKGVILLEYADLGDVISLVRNPLNSEFRNVQTFTDQAGNPVQLNSLQPKVIVDIYKQIVANLDFLHQEVEFNHGDLKANNILVKSSPSRGNYKGLSWDSTFTVKMADFAKSSLTITDNSKRRIRLFNYSSYAERYQSIFPFVPSIDSQFGEPYYVMDANTNASGLAWIRHLGIPFYFSWDTYTFAISMLLIPEVFYPVMTNEKLRAVLFDSLWFADEYSTVWTRLYNAVQAQKPNSYSITLDILRGLKLKCRANNILLEGLKTV